jgi:hypothetical protein
MNIDPFTGLPIEEDPLLEFYAVHNEITMHLIRINLLRTKLLLDIIPRLAIRREEAEINEIAKELLNWDQP